MEGDELPVGWRAVKLSDVASHHSGNSKLIKGKLSAERRAGMHPAYSASGQDVWREGFEQEGAAIVISAVGARCGKCFKADGKWSAIANTHIVWPKQEVADRDFLWFKLNDENFWTRGGSAQPFVKTKESFKQQFGLPPISEQQRIVDKIETLFAELGKGEGALRAVQKLLARYRQSVLKAAVTGVLTADWRATNPPSETGQDLLARILEARRKNWKGRGKYKDPVEPNTVGLPELPEGWVWASLSQLTDIKGGVTVDKKREAADPVILPYLRVANVQNGFLDLREVKEITVDRRKADACLLRPQDILLNEGGDRDKLGRGWVWPGEIDPCIHQNHVYRARPVIPELSSRFVSYYANAFGQPFFMAKGTQSVNLASISLTAISGLPIPLPSLDEQHELVALIEEKVAQIDNGLRACETELTRAKALRQSILKDAFSGKLVPQDPSDEPAAKLLEPIRCVREDEPKATGDLELTIGSHDDFERAKPLILRSYEEN